ncbi:cytochrome P450 [Mycena floridula]|nr:cytochrome P450 [Mycena floridula]
MPFFETGTAPTNPACPSRPPTMAVSPIFQLMLAGWFCHVIFNRFEPRKPSVIGALLFVVPTAIAATISEPFSSHWPVQIILSVSIYVATVVISLLIYRASPVHPLHNYPGPWLFKLSRLPAWYLVRRGDQHLYYQSLHKRYGPFVRTGPNHLHIADAAVIRPVLSSREFSKSARYTPIDSRTVSSLLGLADYQAHAQRRKFWDRALNPVAVKNYQDVLNERVTQLIFQLKLRSDEGAFNLAEWMSFFSFDVMGDMAYGGAFDLMNHGSDNLGLVKIVAEGIQVLELAGTIPWIKHFFDLFPSPVPQLHFRKFATETAQRRISRGVSGTKDLFSYLLDEGGDGGESLPFPILVSETSLALVAGSDTTASVLCNIFYYILSNPSSYNQLASEIDAFGASDLGFNQAALAKLPYLNAVINETMRLQPVIPNGVQRILDPKSRGTSLCGRYVPPSTVVQVSTYIVHRDPVHFSPLPDSFIPERWLPESLLSDHSEFRLNLDAYFPWSIGPTGCAGKHLALMELRSAVSALMLNFKFEFSPTSSDWRPSDWENSLEDRYVLVRGSSLPVTARVRV